MAIPSGLFDSFPPSQPYHLTTFPNVPTSPLSHLSQLPNLTNFPLSSPSQPHSPPSYPFHIPKLTTLPSIIKPLQNNNIRSSLSTLVFKRKLTISLFSPPRKWSQTTRFKLWFANHYTTEISSMWVA